MGDLIALLLLAAALLGVVAALRVLAWAQPGRHAIFRMRFPRTLDEAQATAALRSVQGLLPPWHRRLLGLPAVAFEVRATAVGIEHRLIADERQAHAVAGQLRGAIPGIQLDRVAQGAERRPALARELRRIGPGRLRAREARAISAGILASLGSLRRDEEVVIQWIVAPSAAAPRASTRPLRALSAAPEPTAPSDAARQRQEPELFAAGRVGFRAPSVERRRGLAAQVLGAFHAAGTVDASLRRRFVPTEVVASLLAGARPPLLGYPATFAADELAALVGWPAGAPQLPGLAYVEARELPPIPAVPRIGRVLGAAQSNPERQIAVGIGESLRGIHLLGPTGSGKTTLTERLVDQDIAAGRGVIVFDSRGDMIVEICDRIPPGRIDDVVLFDPRDERPIGYNLLAGGSESSALIVEHLVGQLKAQYRSYLGPRSEHLARTALATLAADPDATILDVPLLLTNDAFRARAVARVNDHALKSTWAWFDSLSDAARSEASSPLVNKFSAYLLNPQLRAVIGQARSPLDFDRLVRERRIVLISLARGVLGSDAVALLGAAMVSRLWQAITGRIEIPPAEREPLFVYCDEAPDYLRPSVPVADAVSQSRGYGVGWAIIHQHLRQLEPEVREACLANLRTRVAMATSANDAAALAREWAPHLTADDLRGLAPHHGYAAVSLGAAVAPPASIVTLPPLPPLGSAADVRRRSRERYGRSRSEVERDLAARAAGELPDAPIGTRRLT